MLQQIISSIGKSLIWIIKTLAISFGLLTAVLSFFAGVLYFFSPDVASLATANPATTAFIELYKEKKKENQAGSDLQWEWMPLSQISPFLIHAIISSEDTTFWEHKGIEWSQIKQAIRITWYQRRIRTGGSTITQQVAKNLYLSPNRTFLRKFRELFITLELERHLSKERILEIYLNIAEWGDGIFGAEAASRHWYNCSANALTPKQAANLALCIPYPKNRNPTQLTIPLQIHANRLLLLMAHDGIISNEMLIESLNMPFDLLQSNGGLGMRSPSQRPIVLSSLAGSGLGHYGLS